MTEHLSPRMLSQFSEFVAERMGLHFSPDHRSDLERGIRSVMRAFAFNDAESCISWLVSSPMTQRQIEILAGHLTIGETYFFREPQSFQALEQHILPELIAKRRDRDPCLRIWSAGCCSGEEPYTVAILLKRLLPDLKDWRITILATDINPDFLKSAAEGLYREWSFRGVPAALKEKYFVKKPSGRFEIVSEIKKMVTFSYLNLAEDAYPALLNNTTALDVILCRNVLMYFSPERAQKTVHNFYRCLVDGGWLAVTQAETSQGLFSRFASAKFAGAALYRKDERREPRAKIFPRQSTNEPKISSELPERLKSRPEIKVPVGRVARERRSDQGKTYPVEVQQNSPRNPHAQVLADYAQGRYAEAVQKLEDLAVEACGDGKAIILLARAYANQGKLTEALEWCEKAIADDKLNPVCHYLLATILKERGRIQDAVASLKRALYLDPNFVLPHFLLGSISCQQGQIQESKRHFGNTLSLLQGYGENEVVPDSEGMTAGRLGEIIRRTVSGEKPA